MDRPVPNLGQIAQEALAVASVNGHMIRPVRTGRVVLFTDDGGARREELGSE